MESKYIQFKPEATKLRTLGHTYGEIKQVLNVKIPKSTLTSWFKKLKLSGESQNRLKNIIKKKTKIAHQAALCANKARRVSYLDAITHRVSHLHDYSEKIDVAKIMLAMLYLGEGTKNRKGDLLFANSNPDIIKLYLKLLRKCYTIDESKFRCTVQCRADHDTVKLEKFWLNITKISAKQLYKTRIDPRTVGKKSKKPNYMGVCCINYFSADIFNEVKKIMELFCSKGL